MSERTVKEREALDARLLAYREKTRSFAKRVVSAALRSLFSEASEFPEVHTIGILMGATDAIAEYTEMAKGLQSERQHASDDYMRRKGHKHQ